MFQFNDTRKDHKQVQLSDKQLKEIENRQKLAIMLNARERIEDYKDKVFGIIDNKGLDNEEDKVKLETALKVLPYIIPQKKAMEMTVTHKTIEQIIQETIPEAEYTEETTPEDTNNKQPDAI